MNKRNYLGIDESNNGRFPRIYAAVFSTNPSDIKNSVRIDKVRGRRSNRLTIALKGRDYRYSVINRTDQDLFGKNISLMAMAELIKSFANLETIIIDGTLSKNNMELLKSYLYTCNIPDIRSEPKADISYPIVNAADNVANLIYRHYSKLRGKVVSRRYLNKFVTPGIKDY